MSQSSPRNVLMLADAPTADRWKGELNAEGAVVWKFAELIPAETTIDVIVANRPPAGDDEIERWAELAGASGERDQSRIGVISVGCNLPADVSLPADATAREAALACRLLAEIVRLRRRIQRGKRTRRSLKRLAHSDPLTGLPNRRAWQRRLTGDLTDAIASGAAICAAVLDVDHFKSVNDRFGHAVGDRVLQAAAEALSASIRTSDFAARLGGDEFGLLLVDISESEASAAIERIRIALGARMSQAAGERISASAGWTLSNAEKHSPELLFAAADRALRFAKRAGRDRTANDDA